MDRKDLANLADEKRRDAEALDRVQSMLERGELSLDDLVIPSAQTPTTGNGSPREGSIPARALQVLTREGRTMKAKEIASRVRESGLDSEENTIVNALYRAAKKGKYIRLVGPSEFAAR